MWGKGEMRMKLQTIGTVQTVMQNPDNAFFTAYLDTVTELQEQAVS